MSPKFGSLTVHTISAQKAVGLCMAVFLLQPIQFGIWLSRISEVQTALALSKSELAFALIGMPVGLLPTLYFTGRIIDRIGPRKALIWAFPVMLLTGILPGLASDGATLFLALVALGSAFAFAEVGLNVFAAQTEKTYGRKIMNRAHGFWSLGVMLGSLLGVQFSALGVGVFGALGLSALGLLPLVLLAAWTLPHYNHSADQVSEPTRRGAIPAGLIPIVVVVFGATIVEGAMNDWATVYMSEAPWGGTARDGLAVTVFAGMVTLGRFLGDALNHRFGPVMLARFCLSLAIVGGVVLVFAQTFLVSLAGFALIGFGVSSIFPLGISAVAGLSSKNEARNVSLMTFGALSGFLIGPPAIGLLADVTTLQWALGALIPILTLSLLMASRLAPRDK